MYYLKISDSTTAMPSHERNLELFQLLETAQCRISELKANPEAYAGEFMHWEETEGKVREQLILANQGLVGSIARKYQNCGLEFDDLISAGQFGLMTAIAKFDCHRGCRFSTHAFLWIKQAITRAICKHGRTIRISEERLAEIRKVKAMQARLRQDSDGDSSREANVEEIAWALGMSENKVRALLALSQQTVSIHAPLGDENGLTYGDVLVNQSAPDPFEAASRADLLEMVDEATKTLPGLEREVFIMHLLDRLSLSEIGETYGRSGERMRQIYNSALEKVRAYVVGKSRRGPVQVVAAKNGKSQPAPAAGEQAAPPVAKGKVYRLKMRAVEKNPNHHITNNNGTWYCKFTLELAAGGKTEVRNSLHTDNVEDARRRRDKLILLYTGLSGSFAA